MGAPSPGDTHLHRYEIHKRVATRLRREHGVTSVAADPSLMRPVRLMAALDRTTFFDLQSRESEATLEFEWRPSPERDEFRIQYTEPETPWACGWHQDETHEDPGSSHFQVDHEAWPARHREAAPFTDPNPMAIIETSLGELREHLPALPEAVRP